MTIEEVKKSVPSYRNSFAPLLVKFAFNYLLSERNLEKVRQMYIIRIPN